MQYLLGSRHIAKRAVLGNHAGNRRRKPRRTDDQQCGVIRIDRFVVLHAVTEHVVHWNTEKRADDLADQSGCAEDERAFDKRFLFVFRHCVP
ncbi:hypothetical protein SDC9_103184 [bioreactor metagenome]|uniref:Uncharacterized protein n=1 Tax=bioreactor metagenome TaxID=1076179 RepID=A0A645ASY7_9ZZZZ